ncbi:GTP pyrophosphokinase, partial [Gordonia alkanivorans]|nr:GTP pyrophosphokinase [Gordonia alkanivorans]
MPDESGTAQHSVTPAADASDDAVGAPTSTSASASTSPSASRRVRARLARRMTATRSQVRPVLEPLVTLHREIYPKADVALLQRAYDVAEER